MVDIGIALPQTGANASPASIVRVAQEAERLDYASVWVLERLLRPTRAISQAPGMPAAQLPEYYATVYDPIETLTYVAAHTQRVKLGTSVINALFHVPVVLARRFATLDQFSNGRVMAGLGQGWMEEEFETANIPLKRRGSGMEDFVMAMKAAWGPDPVRYDGRFYHISESDIGPKPVQAGGPPVLIGAFSPASLERAGRFVDGFNPGAWSWDILEQGIQGFRQAVQAAGRNPEGMPIVVRANAQLSTQPLPDPRPMFSGTVEQIKEDIARMEQIGANHVFFDLNMSSTSIDDQLRLLERLRATADV